MKDILLVGYNEMNFIEYERKMRYFGRDNENFRDFRMCYINYNHVPYTFPELYNEAIRNSNIGSSSFISSKDSFSLTLSTLGSYMHNNGLSFEYIVDFQVEKTSLYNLLKNEEFRSIGITSTFYTTSQPIIEIVKFVRSIDENIPIIIGGPFVAGIIRTQSKEYINNQLHMLAADYIINSSQGEDTLSKLVSCIRDKGNIASINNICYLDKESNEFVHTNIDIERNKLEDNPPNFALFEDSIVDGLTIRTAISCPFSCSFCAFPQHAGDYEVSDIRHIENMMKQIEQIKKIKYINIIDDSFNVPASRFKEILAMKIKNGSIFKWNSYIRCQYLDEEAVMLMKSSGCEGVFLGIESANQMVLDAMNKRVKIAQYEQGIMLLKKYQIPIFASFIFGFPGETRNTIEDTIDFIKKFQPDFYRIQLWYMDKLTPIMNEKIKYRLSGDGFSWEHATMNSKEAQDYVEKAFISITESTWLPQHNFDYTGVISLLHKGYSINQITNMIQIFNKGIYNNITGDNSYQMNKCDFDSFYQKVNEITNS